MDQHEFMQLADQCLARAAAWLEQLDPDEVDYLTGDGVLTMEFGDGSRFVLSRQSATSQIWLAASAAGLHYTYDAASRQWLDDKHGDQLFSRLNKLVADKLGHPVAQ
ncbi:MAG: iron donor protein CyaY [Candidatus Binataceae bacterium]|nr:iron donor protein CyaY [Candidatus Binataceae bacterium]